MPDALFAEHELDPTRLRDALLQTLNEAELRDLCFTLGIEYDDLPPGGRKDRARELVSVCQKQRRLVDLGMALLALRPHLTPRDLIGPTSAAGSPFKGLHYFDEADEPLFFGRDALTETLVKHLLPAAASQMEGERFLAVVGASGSGKSSVVRAGLLPAHGVADSHHYAGGASAGGAGDDADPRQRIGDGDDDADGRSH